MKDSSIGPGLCGQAQTSGPGVWVCRPLRGPGTALFPARCPGPTVAVGMLAGLGLFLQRRGASSLPGFRPALARALSHRWPWV